MKKYSFFILGCIFILAIFLRFFQLGKTPASLHRDEAFLGYNAYSILQTGKDISGNFLPLHLASFIYSPAGYSYAAIPFIKFFSLNAFSIRFASAFFGSLTILLMYFLSEKLFTNYFYKQYVSILASFFLAISPWHINLSRTATENILVVFFIILGTLLYLLWIEKKQYYYIFLAFFSFGITLLMYQAPRAFLPLYIPLLIGTFWKNNNKKAYGISILLFIGIILLPIFYILKSPNLSLRIRTVSVFGTEATQLILNEQIREDGVQHVPSFFVRLFHNKLFNYSTSIWENYIAHFSYNFLFTDTSLPIRYKIPSMGILYFYLLPLLLFGTWFLLHMKDKQIPIFIFGWLFIAPLGSALTFDDVPNLQRTLILLPALLIIAAYGFVQLIFSLKKWRMIFISVSGFLILIHVAYYLHQYYVHSTVHQTLYRQEGYNALVAKVNTYLPNYTKAIITNRESAPAIFFLVYNKYDPARFQKETKRTTIHDFDRISFDRYEFSTEECPAKKILHKDGSITFTARKNILYVNSGLCPPVDKFHTLSIIKRPDHSTAFTIISL